MNTLTKIHPEMETASLWNIAW